MEMGCTETAYFQNVFLVLLEISIIVFSLSSDNLRYGIKFAKRFIDAPDKKLLKKTGEMR